MSQSNDANDASDANDEFRRRYGPWAVIAGASEGIGQAYAEQLAARGLNLITLARRAELLAADAARLRAAHGVEVCPVSLDLAAPDLASRLIAAIGDRDVGLLIYNACYSHIGPYKAGQSGTSPRNSQNDRFRTQKTLQGFHQLCTMDARRLVVLIEEQAMHSMTLEQLRATANVGDVKGVTLKGQGGGFFIEIATRSGQAAILAKARSIEPRRFGSPTSALVVLRDVGITVAQLDATHWDPGQKDMSRSRQSRAEAMREAHEAAAYNQWLATEIQEAIDDPRPSIPHEEVMVRMDARSARHKAAGAKRA